jgi:hypothetical protein
MLPPIVGAPVNTSVEDRMMLENVRNVLALIVVACGAPSPSSALADAANQDHLVVTKLLGNAFRGDGGLWVRATICNQGGVASGVVGDGSVLTADTSFRGIKTARVIIPKDFGLDAGACTERLYAVAGQEYVVEGTSYFMQLSLLEQPELPSGALLLASFEDLGRIAYDRYYAMSGGETTVTEAGTACTGAETVAGRELEVSLFQGRSSETTEYSSGLISARTERDFFSCSARSAVSNNASQGDSTHCSLDLASVLGTAGVLSVNGPLAASGAAAVVALVDGSEVHVRLDCQPKTRTYTYH